MHSKQKYYPEQGGFQQSRRVYQTPPEKPQVETEKKETKVEVVDTSARLAGLSLEIGIETPMKEMIAIERGLTTEGQKADYTFQNEKLTATKEKDGVVWKNEKGDVIQKAVWLKEKTDNKTDADKKNLGGYWNEVGKKYDKDEKIRQAAETEINSDLQKAEAEDIYNLQGGWDKAKMSRMFLGEKKGAGLTFKVDLQGKDKFESFVGAGDILPPTVSKILVMDPNGQQRTGVRQIVNGRVGYYDARGYIPVFSGYTISVLETVAEGSDEAKAQDAKEQQTHTDMKGTIWRKNEAAPTEMGPNISAKTGYRIETVNGRRVEVKPPKPDDKIPEAKTPEPLQKVENPQANIEYFKLGTERVYVDVPLNIEQYKKPPRIVFYFHGNGGNIDENLSFLTRDVQKMRENGDPVILVVPENRIGSWKNFSSPDYFSSLMAMVDQKTGISNSKISLETHSGGYQAVQRILQQDQFADRITDIGLLESCYGGSHRDFMEWAKQPGKKLRSLWTNSYLEGANREMIASLGLERVQPEDPNDPDEVWANADQSVVIRYVHRKGVVHGNCKAAYFGDYATASVA